MAKLELITKDLIQPFFTESVVISVEKGEYDEEEGYIEINIKYCGKSRTPNGFITYADYIVTWYLIDTFLVDHEDTVIAENVYI